MTKRASPWSKWWAVAMRSSSMFYFNISINCRYVRSNKLQPAIVATTENGARLTKRGADVGTWLARPQ